MSDTTDAYRALKTARQEEGAERRSRAAAEWRQLAGECEPFGVRLRRRTEAHYQLSGKGWLLDLYPGNLRVIKTTWPYGYLKLPDEWTLGDVVKAVAGVLESEVAT